MSAPNNEPTLRCQQKKLTKNREKDSKIIFGSKWSEENNEPTFRLYQKIENFFGSELSEANNEPTFRIH